MRCNSAEQGGGDGVEGIREARKYSEKILLLKFTFLEPISPLIPQITIYISNRVDSCAFIKYPCSGLLGQRTLCFLWL